MNERPFDDDKIFRKRFTVPKKAKEDPLVSSSFVCHSKNGINKRDPLH